MKWYKFDTYVSIIEGLGTEKPKSFYQGVHESQKQKRVEPILLLIMTILATFSLQIIQHNPLLKQLGLDRYVHVTALQLHTVNFYVI